MLFTQSSVSHYSSHGCQSYTVVVWGLQVLLLNSSACTIFLLVTTDLTLKGQFQLSLHCHCSWSPPSEPCCLCQGCFHVNVYMPFSSLSCPLSLRTTGAQLVNSSFWYIYFTLQLFLLPFHKTDYIVVITMVYMIQSCQETSWSSWNFNSRFSRKKIRLTYLE